MWFLELQCGDQGKVRSKDQAYDVAISIRIFLAAYNDDDDGGGGGGGGGSVLEVWAPRIEIKRGWEQETRDEVEPPRAHPV